MSFWRKICRSELLWVAPVAVAFALAGCRKIEKLMPRTPLTQHFNLLIWQNYVPPEVIDEFQDDTGIRVDITYFSNNDELLAILEKHEKTFDLAMPSSFLAKQLLEAKMIQPFNLKNLPNLAYFDRVAHKLSFDPGTNWVVPYIWGSTGIGYEKNSVDGLPDSWADLFASHVRDGVARRISLLSDSRFVLGTALIYMGKDPNTTNPEEIEAAGDLILKGQGLEPIYLDGDNVPALLAKREVVMAMAWSGDATKAMKQVVDDVVEESRSENHVPLQAVGQAPHIQFSLPKEGAIVFEDCFVVPKGAGHQRQAEAFLNYLLRPEVAGKVTNFSFYATTLNKADVGPYIERFIINSASYFRHPTGKNFYLEDPGPVARNVYRKVWERVKSRLNIIQYTPTPSP